MSRQQIIVIALFITAAAGLIWLAVPAVKAERTVDAAPAGSQGIGDRQQREKAFFGEKREYDLKGGQEMRPRW